MFEEIYIFLGALGIGILAAIIPALMVYRTDISKTLSKSHENRLGNIIVINASLNGELQNKSHNEKMDLLRNNKTLNNFVKSFVKNNDLEEGPYNFGKITEANLESSHPIENPSEIDKRTTEISGFIFDMYISKMKY